MPASAVSPMSEANKRALIVAFYLSKFDRKGVRALGYATSAEAFSDLGEKLGVNKNTIKQMRDSFDPFCSVVRAGWYQRPILRSRANVIAAYDQASFEAMLYVVQTLIDPVQSAQAVAPYLAPIDENAPDTEIASDDTPYAARIRTGEEAEEVFIAAFPKLAAFNGANLEDTRKWGTGFDFRVTFPGRWVAVEVKGLREARGAISFTDKEWGLAGTLKDDYYLALVRPLDDAPKVELFANPILRLPDVTMRTIESVSVLWTARV